MKIKKHLSSKNIIIKSTTKVAINYQRKFIKKRKNLKVLPYWEEILCKLFEKINLNCNLKKTRHTKRYISTKYLNNYSNAMDCFSFCPKKKSKKDNQRKNVIDPSQIEANSGSNIQTKQPKGFKSYLPKYTRSNKKDHKLVENENASKNPISDPSLMPQITSSTKNTRSEQKRKADIQRVNDVASKDDLGSQSIHQNKEQKRETHSTQDVTKHHEYENSLLHIQRTSKFSNPQQKMPSSLKQDTTLKMAASRNRSESRHKPYSLSEQKSDEYKHTGVVPENTSKIKTDTARNNFEEHTSVYMGTHPDSKNYNDVVSKKHLEQMNAHQRSKQSVVYENPAETKIHAEGAIKQRHVSIEMGPPHFANTASHSNETQNLNGNSTLVTIHKGHGNDIELKILQNERSKTLLETDLDGPPHVSVHRSQEKSDLNKNLDKSCILEIEPASTLPVKDMSYIVTKAKEQTRFSDHPVNSEAMEPTTQTCNDITETSVVNVKPDTENKTSNKLTKDHKLSLMKPLDDGKQNYQPAYTLPLNTDAFNSMPSPSLLINPAYTLPLNTDAFISMPSPSPLINNAYTPQWNTQAFNSMTSPSPLINRTLYSPNYGHKSPNNIFDYEYADGLNKTRRISNETIAAKINKTQSYESQSEKSKTLKNEFMHAEKNVGTTKEQVTDKDSNISDKMEGIGSNKMDVVICVDEITSKTQSSTISGKSHNPYSSNNRDQTQNFDSIPKQDSYANQRKHRLEDSKENDVKKSKLESDNHETEMMKPKFDFTKGSEINPGPALTPKIPIHSTDFKESVYHTSPTESTKQGITLYDSALPEIFNSYTKKSEANLTSKNSNDNLTLLAQDDIDTTPYIESPTHKIEMEVEELSINSKFQLDASKTNDGNESIIKTIETKENLNFNDVTSTSRHQEDIESKQQDLEESDASNVVSFNEVDFDNSESESENTISTYSNKHDQSDEKANQIHSNVTTNTDKIPMSTKQNEFTTSINSSTPESQHNQRDELSYKSTTVQPALPAVEYLYGKPVIRESHFKSSNYAENLASQEVVKTISALNATSKEIDDLEANMSKYSGTVKQLDTFERIVTKAMLKLDKIESHGKPELRARRKDLVIRMKALLKRIDAQRNTLQP